MGSQPLTIGIATPVDFWTSDLDRRHEIMERVATLGIDRVYIADHESFRNGSGTDGFVEIAALSQCHPSLDVMISVYLLALRHPVTVARQLATMSTIAPGRVILGVGVGGEDREEIEACGVDPRTRGRRTDESLHILRHLMGGQPLSFDGEFFHLDDVSIRPAIDPPTPLIIGGRSDAALHRTARHGDGWIGAWCSPRRFAEAVQIIDDTAAAIGRIDTRWTHGYQPWVGVADAVDDARSLVGDAMEAFYRVPFSAFERYTPVGTPADIAATLRAHREAGCSMFNLKVVAGTDAESLEATGEIARLLRESPGTS